MTAKEIRESAARAKRGTVGADSVRKMTADVDSLGLDTMQKPQLDAYNASILEARRGKYTPLSCDSFEEAKACFDRFLILRLGLNCNKLKAETKEVGIAIIPLGVMLKELPTDEQKEEWQSLWDSDAPLRKLTKILAPGCNVYPMIIHTANANIHTQFSVGLIYIKSGAV